MKIISGLALGGAAVAALAIGADASANIRITEWMYSGNTSEYIEFTNVGAVPINMAGWSYDDDSNTPGTVSLSAFGIVNPGESVLLIENADTAAFRTGWGLGAAVDIIGGNAANLGRNDQINLYDDGNALVDRLSFGDQTFAGSIRTQNVSGWTTPANLGTNNVFAWQLSVVADGQNSWTSAQGDIGNPGVYAVPAPGAIALLGLAGLVGARRRRSV